MTMGANAFLACASLFFYSWWNIAYLPLILASIIFNFFIGRRIASKDEVNFGFLTSKRVLVLGIIANVGLLGYYKYSDFFIHNVNSFFDRDYGLLHLILPLAISFFTFQQIAYLVDSYKKGIKEYNFINYTLFVTFFPQLLAGPIVHHSEMMPQFATLRTKLINYDNIAKGMFIFTIGLFKKVVIADTFAEWVNYGYYGTEAIDMLSAWATTLSFSFQIYFDYSGYTDMAIGIALLFNIVLPINFFSPLKSQNIQIFWRRWNMTLTRFLKEYIFMPLGGVRRGRIIACVNLIITFTLGGLWHGADWTFVFWGVLHGTGLVVFILWKKYGFKMYGWLAWFITVNFINVSIVFFRAENWTAAIRMLKGMVAYDMLNLPGPLRFENNLNIKFDNFLGAINGDIWTIVWIFSGFILVLCFKNSIEKMNEYKPSFFNVIFMSFTLLVGILYIVKESEFLYYNF
ncbi:MAG: MBOAT family protein [Emcibacteraceae bacterium]|nr:MBOAT family protein [Emcibacteraceae bacterium]